MYMSAENCTKKHAYPWLCRKGVNKGAANGAWKGDAVALDALHDWVKRQLFRPDHCTGCGQKKALDLANISQEYHRDIADWEWLCRRCHMTKDGRLPKFQTMKERVNRGSRNGRFRHGRYAKRFPCPHQGGQDLPSCTGCTVPTRSARPIRDAPLSMACGVRVGQKCLQNP